MAITLNGSTGISTPGMTNAGNETVAGTLQVGGISTNVYPLISGTAVVSTSGTAIDYTGIPSWVKRITVMMSGVSTNGSSALQVQLGDSGGIEATGYIASAVVIGPTTGYGSSTTGVLVDGSAGASIIRSGALVFTLVTGTTWVASGSFVRADATGYMVTVSGSKTLSDTLDRVRVAPYNGTDAFDAGSINILYE